MAMDLSKQKKDTVPKNPSQDEDSDVVSFGRYLHRGKDGPEDDPPKRKRMTAIFGRGQGTGKNLEDDIADGVNEGRKNHQPKSAREKLSHPVHPCPAHFN